MRHKIFRERVSLYDHLCETNTYIHGMYEACKVQLTLFLVYIFLRDSYAAGKLFVDICDETIVGSFEGWLLLLGLEVTLVVVFLSLYPVFQLWQSLRMKVGMIADIIYIFYLCGYVVLSFFLLFITGATKTMGKMPRVIAAVECSRLLMKTVSFVGENRYKVLYPWSKDDEKGPAQWYNGQMSPQVGSFSQYAYFMVAPTLIYRDHYPRHKGNINWRNAVAYACQFATLGLLVKVLFMEQYPKSFRREDIVGMYMKLILVAPVMYFLCSISMLHAWFNFTAELTKFADREFYSNWWSALGYTEWYRLWNVPIHDFTTIYIYRPLVPYVSRAMAGFVVFTLSAFMHDFIIGFAMGFFLPVFLFLFAIVGGTVFATGVKFPKYLTFTFHCVGYVSYMGIYYLELGARHYCPQTQDTAILALHSPHCFQVHNNGTFSLWS